jgi:hypothetical protein
VLKSIPNDHLNRKKMRLPTGFYTQHFAHVEAWPHPVRVQLQVRQATPQPRGLCLRTKLLLCLVVG